MRGYESLTASAEPAARPRVGADAVRLGGPARQGDFAAGFRTRLRDAGVFESFATGMCSPRAPAAPPFGDFARGVRSQAASARRAISRRACEDLTPGRRGRTPWTARGHIASAGRSTGRPPERAAVPGARARSGSPRRRSRSWRMYRSGRRWSAWRGGARQRCLDPRQHARERVDLRSRQIPDQRREPPGQQRLGAAQHRLPLRGQQKLLTSAIPVGCPPVEQARVAQSVEELRDGRTRHTGASRELVDRNLFARDRAQRQILRGRQRRLVTGQQPLDPTRDQRRDGHQRLGGLGLGMMGTRH